MKRMLICLIALALVSVACGSSVSVDQKKPSGNYEVVRQNIEDTETGTRVYFDAITPATSERDLESVAESIVEDFSAYDAIIARIKNDAEMDAPAIATLRASYTDAGKSMTGIEAGRYELVPV